MQEASPCAFPPCPRQGVVTLSLVVDGCVSVVLACMRHADWLTAYAEEDAGVQLEDPALEEEHPFASGA